MYFRPAGNDPLTQGDVIDVIVPASAPALAVAESLIDLRDVHSVPRVVLEQLIADGKRPASLTSPYREHLAQHFAVTYMRVALPEPYPTQP